MKRGYLSSVVACDNLITAHDATIPYSDWLVLQKRIGKVIDNHLHEKSSCFMLPGASSVLFAAVAHYLLLNQVSFFLQSQNNITGDGIPPFCDKVLHLGKSVDELTVVDNLEFSESSNSSITPGSVVFTSSGTTGSPKYVRFDNASLIENARNCVARFELTSSSRILVPVPLAHMYGMGVGLLPALLVAANVCLVEKSNVIKLYDKLKEFCPDVVLVNPTICKMLLQLNKPVAGNRIFISAGEKLDGGIRERFSATFGPIYNLYGCTELGAIAVSTDYDPDSVKPLTGVEIRINSERHGEILCRHKAGFSNYTDGFGKRSGDAAGAQMWYSTKDLGSINDDGTFTVLGRTDNCVNRSGFLVSLEEIEGSLEKTLRDIKQAIAFEIDNHNGLRNRLVAVCEIDDHAVINEAAAREACRQVMKEHTVPDSFHFVNNLPRLGNGKPDRLSVSRLYAPIHLNQTNIV